MAEKHAKTHAKAMEDFRRQQYAFAAHLRNPEANPAPEGIEERRLDVYRELFFNNVKGLLAGTFPVLHSILAKDRWTVLVRDFYHHHISHTPLFLEIPQEFLAWLQEDFEHGDDWPAFMLELAHYEWVELALMVDPQDIDSVAADTDGNILDGIPVISPVAWPLAYAFPVHRIGAQFQPEEPGEQPTFLVVYRKRDDKVGFTEVNGVTARLLELMQENETKTSRELLQQIAGEINHPDPQAVIQGGADILAGLMEQEIVLGTQR